MKTQTMEIINLKPSEYLGAIVKALKDERLNKIIILSNIRNGGIPLDVLSLMYLTDTKEEELKYIDDMIISKYDSFRKILPDNIIGLYYSPIIDLVCGVLESYITGLHFLMNELYVKEFIQVMDKYKNDFTGYYNDPDKFESTVNEIYEDLIAHKL